MHLNRTLVIIKGGSALAFCSLPIHNLSTSLVFHAATLQRIWILSGSTTAFKCAIMTVFALVTKLVD